MNVNERLQHRLHISTRYNPWAYMLAVAVNKARRPLCLLRRHRRWARETTLIPIAYGRSKRCGACNRLVLKPQYRKVSR